MAETKDTPARSLIRVKTVVHLVKLGSRTFACCQKTPYTVPISDSVTTDPLRVTCGG